MNELLVQIGTRLREHRKSLGMTQQNVADILEISMKFYGQIERGESKISVDKVIVLYEKLDLEPTYLLTGNKSTIDFKEFIADCPRDKVFDLEQILKYSSNLYK
ncbi:MAG: helix-turn-helix domain-containing protein [Oscillospiraceae bacterium]|nr:helix-turn-helix domain-containing protein [Oscillospiraceae bacterium]